MADLVKNFATLADAVLRSKPSAAKGTFVKSVYLSTTMGPGIKLDPKNFAAEVKEYKQNPDAFPGHVGDISTVIRVAVTGRTKSPDLCSIMKTLGKEKVMERIDRAVIALGK